MNKILIIDASESDCRLMSGLLTRTGYEPIAVGSMEAAKEEVAKPATRRGWSYGNEIPWRHSARVNQLAKFIISCILEF